MKNILIAGLCIGLMGCSHARTNVLLSQSEINGIFGGVTDKYSPTMITLEAEGKKSAGNITSLTSAFYGWEDHGYEFGADLGLKYSLTDSFYTKGKIGADYESKKFEEQRTHINLHINLEVGFEGKIGERIWTFGGVFDHRSNGNSFLKNIGIDVNNEPNRGINTIGYQIGVSF